MIIVMEREATDVQVAAVEAKIRTHGLEVHVSRGTERTLIGAIGDERKLDPEMFETMEGVEKSMHIVKPYKLVAREWHKANTVITAGGIPIGGKTVQVIAGPCSVETDAQMHAAAAGARAGGARLMRGGAFKPRTSPYAFQGKGIEGLKLLKDAAASCKLAGRDRAHGRADARRVPGARRRRDPDRHAQHAELRPAEGRGRVTTPVILKRGMSATISEWLMAGEYIAAGGNHNIIFCERGIRTFETAYRNVLDVTAIAVMKRETHLPVIVDPSHAGGKAWMVPALSCAAVAAGADGLLIEIHPTPKEAWCDADQALTPDEFATLMRQLDAMARAVGREL